MGATLGAALTPPTNPLLPNLQSVHMTLPDELIRWVGGGLERPTRYSRGLGCAATLWL